jgi:GNAT superfamily N-acetyltransferase
MITIRKAKLVDLASLANLGIELLKYHVKFDKYYTPNKNAKNEYLKFFKRSIYSPEKYVLVAETNNKIVGYAIGELIRRPPVYVVRNIGGLSDMFILSDYRKSGVGKRFFDELIKWFKSKKVKYIELSVDARNEIGKKAWDKYGFKDFHFKKKLKLGK